MSIQILSGVPREDVIAALDDDLMAATDDAPGHHGAGPHYRIRHDRIDKTGAVSLRRAGRMHHIGIGRAHKHTRVILLIDDLNIRVIHATTGELLRALTLNPNRGYQPRFKT